MRREMIRSGGSGTPELEKPNNLCAGYVQASSQCVDHNIGHLWMPAQRKELMKFVRHAVTCGKEECKENGVLGKRRKNLLVLQRFSNQETEDAEVDEMDELCPSPKTYLREIERRNGGAREDQHHPEQRQNLVSHTIRYGFRRGVSTTPDRLQTIRQY